MSRRRQRSSWTLAGPVLGPALAGVCLLAPACAQPERWYDADHVRVGTYFSKTLCRGEIEALDRFTARVKQDLGISGGRQVEVRWLLLDEVEDFLPAGCTSYEWRPRGCMVAGVAHGTRLSLEHEIVHALD
ncbi:hypothetical protein, partial [Oceanithermus profundus]